MERWRRCGINNSARNVQDERRQRQPLPSFLPSAPESRCHALLPPCKARKGDGRLSQTCLKIVTPASPAYSFHFHPFRRGHPVYQRLSVGLGRQKVQKWMDGIIAVDAQSLPPAAAAATPNSDIDLLSGLMMDLLFLEVD